MIANLAQTVSESAPGPITTGAVFVGLTTAVAYLYRARERDRSRQIDELRDELSKLRQILNERPHRDR